MLKMQQPCALHQPLHYILYADHYKWVWIGIGYLIFCIILFNGILIWAHVALGCKSLVQIYDGAATHISLRNVSPQTAQYAGL